VDEAVTSAEPNIPLLRVRQAMTERIPIQTLLEEVMHSHASVDDPDYNFCDVTMCEWCKSAKAHILEMRGPFTETNDFGDPYDPKEY